MLWTLRIVPLMLAVLVGNPGCGQSGPSATDAINHERLSQSNAKADQRVGKTLDNPVGLLKEPLAAFLKEDPRKCNSPALQKAVNSSLQIGGGLDTKYGTPISKKSVPSCSTWQTRPTTPDALRSPDRSMIL